MVPNFRFSNVIKFICVFAFSAVSLSAHAALQVETTRVIYESKQKEVSLRVKNTVNYPVLLQAWIDPKAKVQDRAVQGELVPFFVTPPLARVNPNKSQLLRIIYTGEPLAADRESLFWLNIQEIPPKTDVQQNSLLITILTKLKLIFRPNGLKGNSSDAVALTTWKFKKNEAGKTVLYAYNPTPFFLNLAEITVHQGAKVFTLEASQVHAVPPKAGTEFYVPDTFSVSNSPKVDLVYVNDFGSSINYSPGQMKKLDG